MNEYAGASTLVSADQGRALTLETATGRTPQGVVEHPTFFSGLVARPDVVAAGLLAVADVAATTYFDLSASRASLDPVVTASGDRLRFESFSRCNGVYARFDLLAEGIASGGAGFGTTNVDINAPLRGMLASVAPTELLHLAVGLEELRVATPDETHTERRVDLPDRWVRGFAEVPSIAGDMELAGQLDRVETMRFLAGLPRSAPGPSLHFTRTPRGLLTSATAAACEVHVAGTARLTSARRFSRFVTQTLVFRHPSDASGWVFEFDGGRVTLLLSPAPYRGFSGEGAQLRDLGAAGSESLPLLEHLAWQPVIDPVALADEIEVSVATVRAGLAVLATSGRIGFDLSDQAWFHRELPIDDERVTRDNPRLVKARAIVEAGGVQVVDRQWRVGEAGSARWVHHDGTRLVCTCPWEARYGGSRGPCSHVLAVGITQPNPGSL